MNSPVPGPPPPGRSWTVLLKNAWDLEFSQLRWRLMVCNLVARLLPEGKAAAFRTSLVRSVGLNIGPGSLFLGMPRIQSAPRGSLRPRFHMGAGCTVGARAILEFGEVLTIGDRVSLGAGCVILTSTHQLGPKENRAGPVVMTPVTIGNDVVIGENAVILPGARIGDGARVLPYSVVNANVAAGAIVSGIPARPQRPAATPAPASTPAPTSQS